MALKPTSDAPVTFVRLYPKDHAAAKRLAKAEQMPLSTWMRRVIVNHIRFEQEERAK